MRNFLKIIFSGSAGIVHLLAALSSLALVFSPSNSLAEPPLNPAWRYQKDPRKRTELLAEAKTIQKQLIAERAVDEKCRAGDVASCRSIGDKYFDRKNWVTAEEYFDKACDLKDIDACRMRAHCWGHQGNEILFKFNLGMACDLRNERACDDQKNEITIFQSFKPDIAAFEIQKEKLKEQIAAANLIAAEKKRQEDQKAEIAEERNRQATEKKLAGRLAKCDKKSARSCFESGVYYDSVKDPASALGQFEKACDLKDYNSCYIAGLVASEQRSFEYSKRLLGFACDKKIREACKRLDGLNQALHDQEIVDAGRRQDALLEQQSRMADLQRRQYEQAQAHDAAAEESRRAQALQNSMSAMSNFLNPPQPQAAPETNCETQPVTDMYSGKISSYRTVCH